MGITVQVNLYHSCIDNDMIFGVPSSPHYGCCIYSGFESPGEWDDHHRIFGLDGPDIQYSVSCVIYSHLPSLLHKSCGLV